MSAAITDERVMEVLGEDAAIWAIEADQPHNDIMQRQADLSEFRRLTRTIFNAIKTTHGERAVINIFPAMPVSAAVELGRVWMPKADLPLRIYDQNRTLDGFKSAFEIGALPGSEPAMHPSHVGSFPLKPRSKPRGAKTGAGANWKKSLSTESLSQAG